MKHKYPHKMENVHPRTVSCVLLHKKVIFNTLLLFVIHLINEKTSAGQRTESFYIAQNVTILDSDQGMAVSI